LVASDADDGTCKLAEWRYSTDKAAGLKCESFDRIPLGKRDLLYKQLDQLTIELLLGIR
jgi:hypothetical protein